MNSAIRLSAGILLMVCSLELSASEETPAAGNEATAPATEATGPARLSARIRGLFDVDLPELDPRGTVKLLFRPHFGDLIRRDYIRVATGARWTVTDRIELNFEAEAFATHGMGGGDDGYGIGEARFGGRYLLREWPAPNYESTLGLDIQVPTGNPPLDLTDGHNHYKPSFVTQHRWASNPKLTTFAGAELDFVTESSVRGDFARNQPTDDSVAFTGGAVYDLGQFKWTLQATYANMWLSGNNEHFFTVVPSVLWFVPKKYTFNMKTQWILGFGARAVWGPEGHEFSTSNRVRAEITFRQVLDQIRLNYDRDK